MRGVINLVCLSAALLPLSILRARTSAAQITTEAVYYTVPSLDPGRYQISVQVPGFKPVLRTNIDLQVDQVARIDFKLELGESFPADHSSPDAWVTKK